MTKLKAEIAHQIHDGVFYLGLVLKRSFFWPGWFLISYLLLKNVVKYVKRSGKGTHTSSNTVFRRVTERNGDELLKVLEM